MKKNKNIHYKTIKIYIFYSKIIIFIINIKNKRWKKEL